MREALWVGLCGALGCLCRAGLGLLLARCASPLPLGTWAVNLLGSLALGLVLGHPGLPPLWRSALGIGFLGGFTTFSSWAVEGARLLEAGRPWAAALHLGGQLLVGLLAALAGLALARRLWGA